MGRCPTNYEKGLNNMEKSALTNITEKLTQSEKIFVSDLKLLAGEARRQAYRSADHLLVVRNWLIGWHIVTQEQKERNVRNMANMSSNWPPKPLQKNTAEDSD